METNGINVLSLFDGMSCGMIALERAGIPVKNYYASEIDKYAITVSKANYPQIQQIGSVTDLNYIDGYLCSPTQQIYVGEIDLLIGGSPCQNFSFAGSRKGMVTKDNVEVLSLDQYLELKRDGFEFKGESFLFWEYVRLLKEIKPKKFLLENVRMHDKWKNIINSIIGYQSLEINSSLLSGQNRPRLYWTNINSINMPIDKKIDIKVLLGGECRSITNQGKTVGKVLNKSYCLLARDYKGFGNQAMTGIKVGDTDLFRRLTPKEYEILQTVPEDYTSHVSNSQRYKMLGNGWTVDVIAHIFKNLKHGTNR